MTLKIKKSSIFVIKTPIKKLKVLMRYLTTTTIEKAYESLTSVEVKNASILHIFFILKGCGINDLNFKSVNTISQNGYPFAANLSLLFSNEEVKPEKYDFINPFSMSLWAKQAPSEKLKDWVSGRIKNNIIGGATTWRKIINEDIHKNEIKFTYNYIEEIKELTLENSKIKLWALAVWYNRFNQFERDTSPMEIIQSFLKDFNISDNEKGVLLDSTINFEPNFSDQIPNYEEIRNLIGTPEKATSEWLMSVKNEILKSTTLNHTQNNKFLIMENNITPSVEKIINLLDSNYQILLSGPPGTSKSYLANQIANNYIKLNVLKIQFHPQYSYQDFIGGFIVNGDKVVPNRGTFLKFIDKAKASTEPHLLIIDEINRANVSSVFGDTIQCLDRNYTTEINIGGIQEEISIPDNLLIIATMNTADRTLGNLDFALRRRFANIYVGTNEVELINNTSTESGISLSDFLKKINTRLKIALQNNELVIGQSIFYNSKKIDNSKFHWNDEDLEDLFNYKILPIIEDYCNNEQSVIEEILDSELPKQLIENPFKEAIKNYLS
jgi:5-methylcytosine-specific restriction protein B